MQGQSSSKKISSPIKTFGLYMMACPFLTDLGMKVASNYPDVKEYLDRIPYVEGHEKRFIARFLIKSLG